MGVRKCPLVCFTGCRPACAKSFDTSGTTAAVSGGAHTRLRPGMSGFEPPCKNQLPALRQLVPRFSLTDNVKDLQSIFTEVFFKPLVVTFGFKVSRASLPDLSPVGNVGIYSVVYETLSYNNGKLNSLARSWKYIVFFCHFGVAVRGVALLR